MQREESYEEQIRDCTARLKDVNILFFLFHIFYCVQLEIFKCAHYIEPLFLFYFSLSQIANQAEQRADLAERTMAKLQKEVDRLEGNTLTCL